VSARGPDDPRPRRIDVLGCPFDAVSFAETVAEIRAAVEQDSHLQVVPGNVDFVMKARRDPGFAADLARADLVVADGVPVVWAASLLGRPLRGRSCSAGRPPRLYWATQFLTERSEQLRAWAI